MLRPVASCQLRHFEAACAASTTAALACCVGLLPGSASLPREGISAQACQHLRSFLKSGPKRVVFDVRNGVITKLFRRHSVALGRFDNPLGESGAD